MSLEGAIISLKNVTKAFGEFKAIESKDGTIIIPISKVSFGFAAGGSEFNLEKKESVKYPFGGGSGAGVTVKPVAFLIIKSDNVKLLPVEYDNSIDKVIDSIPQFIESIKNLTSKNKNNLTLHSSSEILQNSHDKDYMPKSKKSKPNEVSSLLCKNKWDKPHENIVLTSGANFSYSL
jgi:sporulation protein YtfJ